MNAVNFIKSLLFSAALALLGYLAVQFLNIQISGSVLFAAGLVIGGVVVPLFLPSHSADDIDDEEDDEDHHVEPGEVKTLYVGNLPYRANEAAVRELFEKYGKVFSVRLMKDRQTGRRKGYGFVEMSQADASKAVTALNDNEFQQRTLKVREAKERKDEDT
ncbi:MULTISPECIES: RNA recognition motif domain-containing protein [Corallincola]|uniref:RNA-binding protein n=3 Tax=Corallincola TaxID=1775176 RepID=A0A368NLW9_9GAMM|nr:MULTISPECIES: RNA-binding protein [Corallincola]RCU51156.1 RNA-binding protein [Corallincola holothuriorum]TAA46087.1 RNA-binding protein [Corallincola spongiicola]TCI01451.1 RNA-binding protein [Corallincola luteus]